MSQQAPRVRLFVPADQPKLKAMAEAIKASGVPSRGYALRSEQETDILFLVADAGERFDGSLMALTNPGAMAMVISPLSVHPLATKEATEDALLGTAARELKAAGQKLAYAVFPIDVAEAETAPFARAGYRSITELIYLRRPLDEAPAAAPLDDLVLQPFEADQRRFAETLLATYAQTLDCPEMDGLRSVQEILRGHANAGTSGVSRWRLILRAGAPVGVHMVAEIDDENALDLVYLGLVPDARRHGLGRRLLANLTQEAKEEGWAQITLSVDSRNVPALRLYERHGFVPYDRRRLTLLDLNGWAPSSSAT